jgi:alanine dehydrogenase
LRTAAASAAAIRHLASEDASVMAVIGCGVQGRAELAGALAVRQLSRIHVFDTERAKALAFRAELMERHGVDIVVEEDAETAVQAAGIVALATTASDPVVPAAAFRPGVHINAVGAHTPGTREMDSDTVARGRLFVESRPAILAEAGDVLIPLRENRFTEAHIVGELGAVAAGTVPGRTAPEDMTIFKSTGVAVEDVVAARLIYQAALARGVGTFVAM